MLFAVSDYDHVNRKDRRNTNEENPGYYFKDDKLVSWIGEDGKQVSPTAPEFAQGEARLLASSK